MTQPDYSYETQAAAQGYVRIAGVDEVGRGPLAGPVTAAAVWLDPANVPEGLNDSKRLSPAKRAALFDILREVADISVAHATVAEIETLNILGAAHLAMRRAVSGLARAPDHLIIDGNRAPRGLNHSHDMVVRGDARCLSVAAASIVAKVSRDRLMVDLAQHYPGYGWERNAGYPTKEHREALQKLGATPEHRRSFRPVHNILYQENSLSG